MPKLTREQATKWTKDLPQGWRFDAQHYVFWGEKEIFTDSPENEKGVFYRLTLEYRAETVNAGYFRKETGRQIPTVTLHRYTPTGSGEMYSVVHIMQEAAAEPQSKKKYDVLVKLAANFAEHGTTEIYFKHAAEKDTGKQYNDFSDFCAPVADAEPAEEPAEPAQEVAESAETTAPAEDTPETESTTETEDTPETESTTETEEIADNGAAFDIPTIPEKCRKAYFDGEMTLEQIAAELYSAGMIAYIDANAAADYLGLEREEEPGEDASAEIVTEDAQTVEEPAQEESKEEPAPAAGMFATLAAAYFSGKTIKSKPRTAEPKADEPPKEEEPAPEPEPEPAPPVPGWHENDNERWKLSEDERKSLFCGFPVVRKERYNNGASFSVAYSERVRMVYNVHSYDERDNVNPGRDASFCGFMIDGNIYSSDIRKIDEKYTEDINRYLLEHVQSETDAAHIAANIDSEYERGRLEELKERDFYDDAKRLFFDHKKPRLVLYWKNNDRETHGYDAIINYLLEPEKAVETAALRYMCEKPQNIYSAWIKYNRLSATFGRINSDSENAEHKLRRISECITDQKAVRIKFENGNEVKCEADAVKRIPCCGYISNYYFTASDRKYLPKDESGRNRDVHAEDIVCISHGGRVLYSA